ncbi:MAG: MBL fold metallo-hydrolase [Ilumatobacteraceae bacterium]|nr:MBL fold metallo-hydrolase [Ilumatobacteraceae bacterium]
MIDLNADTDVANVHSVVAAGAVLIDVREPDEFAEGTIDGARNIPLGEVEGHIRLLDKATPIAFLCRSGNRSGKAAELYREAGYKAVNLRGGMLAWAEAQRSDTLLCQQFYLDCLSQASYLIIDKTSKRAVVVDPTRDVQQYIDSAATHGAKIELVLETHFHADFLSGHLELASATGAVIGYGAAAKPEFAARLFADGERYPLGRVELEMRLTPGHTPESMSIVVWEHPDDTAPYAVLTGDTLFIGDVGRPDLLVSVGKTADELGSMLFNSLHDKLLTLPDSTRVLPAHGAGSACGKNLSTETMSTIGDQRRDNYALQIRDAAKFVEIVSEGQPPAPGYFVFDAKLNAQNRDVLDEHTPPKKLTIGEAMWRGRHGARILDTRDPQYFALGHLRGSVNVGLQGRYAEFAGAVVNPDEEIIVVTEPGTELEAKVRLARIGYDKLLGWVSVDDLASDFDNVVQASRLTRAQFAVRRHKIDNVQVVDVRNEGEVHGGMVDGARNIPIAQLRSRLAELDPKKPTVVYCAGGYRSSIAASLLREAGFADVSDVLGGYAAIAA